MKKIFYILPGSLLLFFCSDLLGQNFVNGGNNLSALGRLGTTSNQSLAFITGNTERARITNSGKFGIGTSSPVTRFHVNGVSSFGKNVTTSNATRVLNLVDDNAVMRILRVHPTFAPAVELISRTSANGANVAYWDFYAEPSDASFRIRDRIGGGAGPDRVIITPNGDVGIGTNNIFARLDVAVSDSSSVGIASNGAQVGVLSYGLEAGVVGHSDRPFSTGVRGVSDYGTGVDGSSFDSYGGDFGSVNGTGLIARTYGGGYAAEFYGPIYSSEGFQTTSDRNLKKDIQEFGDGMSIINKLKPQNYEFKNDAKYASLHLPKGRHYGLLAQDLEQVLPNLVSEAPHELKTVKPVTLLKPTADGRPARVIAEPKEPKESINIKAVNYLELIPIMVKAMQEQDATIKKQDAKIEELTQLVNKLSQNTSASGSVKLNSAFLGQNTPNPNRTGTRISYNIPTDSRAELVVNNANGQKIKQIQLSKSGLIDLDTSTLSAGTYFYTLFVNGKSIDTKKMIVNR